MIPWVLLAFTAALFFGTSKVLVRKAMDVNAFIMVLYTLLMAPPVLLCALIASGDLFMKHNYDLLTIAYLGLSGVLQLVVGRIFAYSSIKLIGASRASQLTGTQVIFATIMSVGILQEEINLILVTGILAIFLGAVFISFSSPPGEIDGGIPAKRFSTGLSLGLLGGFTWGLSQLFAREGVRGFRSPIMSSFISYLFAISTLVVIMPFVSNREGLKLKLTQTICLFGSGTLTVFAFLAHYMALRLASIVTVNPIVSTSPLITLIVSYLLIRNIEFIGKKVLFGAIAVVFGAAIIALLGYK